MAEINRFVLLGESTPELADMVARSEVSLNQDAQDLPATLANASAILHHGRLATTEMALAMRVAAIFPAAPPGTIADGGCRSKTRLRHESFPAKGRRG